MHIMEIRINVTIKAEHNYIVQDAYNSKYYI